MTTSDSGSRRSGSFEAEVLPETDEDDETEGQWQQLDSPQEMVQFYDPTDLFGDLAETLADNSFPGIAPGDDELDEDGEDASGSGTAATADEGENNEGVSNYDESAEAAADGEDEGADDEESDDPDEDAPSTR